MESCQTCKYRTGTKCWKNKETITLQDWCNSFKERKGIIPEEMILTPKKDLKLFIELNPEMYDPELHESLFTEEEKINLSQSMRTE